MQQKLKEKEYETIRAGSGIPADAKAKQGSRVPAFSVEYSSGYGKRKYQMDFC